MSNNVHQYLVQHGPSIRQHLPRRPDVHARQYGVNSFNIKGGGRCAETRTDGITTPVYYVEDYHTAEEVLAYWADENENQLAATGVRAIHMRICVNHSDRWKQASREVLDLDGEYDGGHPSRDHGGICSRCGNEYEGYLPTHLRRCQA